MNSSAPVPPVSFTHREVLRILSGVLLCMLMAALDQTVLATALPAIAADFNGVPHLSWVITAYLLFSTAATIMLGKLSDLYGRRRLLELSIGVFLLASLACAVSQSMGSLIAARALQGLGGGGLYSMSQASIGDVVSARERGRYQAYITSTYGVASIAGPLIGGFCVEYLSWRWAFWLNLPIGILAFAFCHRGLAKVIVRRQRRPIDFLGAALILPGVTAWMLLAAWGGSEVPWVSLTTFGLAAAGAAFVAAFVIRERLAPEALLPPRLFASQTFRVATILNFFINAITVGTYMLLPVFFQLVIGVDAEFSGAMLIVPLLTQIVASIYAGRRVQQTGRYVWAPRIGFGALIVSAALFGTMTATIPIWRVEGFMMVNALGMGLCQAPLWVAVQNSAELRDMGAVTGSTAFFRALGGAFGAAMLWSVLLAMLDSTVAAEGHAGFGSSLLRGGRVALAALPADVRIFFVPAFGHAFHITFLLAAGLAAIAFGATYFLKEIPLRTSTHAIAKDERSISASSLPE
ncbi:MAG TPA: MDR family MFS transporter [Stellaceae bacterium]|nr:MDR family MFS transporter [Stellaceae bacterium]